MKNFIQWYLVNKSNKSSNSPSTELMKTISDSVFQLFTIVADYEEVTKCKKNNYFYYFFYLLYLKK